MRTTDWDRIVTSAPLNRDAAVARDACGVAYTPAIADDDNVIRSDTPLPVRKPSKGTDLSGKRCNRLVVQGLYAVEGKSNRWVVRCDCGAYETRRATSLNNPAYAATAMCSHCDHLEQLRRGLKPKGPMLGVTWKSLMHAGPGR